MDKSLGFKAQTLSKFLLIVLGIFLLGFPIFLSSTAPDLMIFTDFDLTFYPAGKLIIGQRAEDLYHCNLNLPFSFSAFNHFVHEIYPQLPKEFTAIYMYSPLTALAFSPYSLTTPQASLIAWQLTSIIAFFVSIFFVSKAIGVDFKISLWHGLLYFTVFQTLLIGQLGIVFGLLPLSIGYFFLIKGRLFLGGLCWSFLLLKPQYLPVPLLIAAALALIKKFQCLTGFLLGLITLLALTFLFNPPLFVQWLNSLQLSDTLFSDSHYFCPVHLITSLPAAILELFPAGWRNIIKIPDYLLALLLSIQALWLSNRLIKFTITRVESAITAVFIIGIAILPLIVPHFLFYDLSVFALFAALFRYPGWTKHQKQCLKNLDWVYVISIDIYYLLLSGPLRAVLQPMIFIVVMALTYYLLLKTLKKDYTREDQ